MKPTRANPAAVFDKIRDVPGYRTVEDILTKSGYSLFRILVDTSRDKGEPPEHCFEFWRGPKGVVILQLWNDGAGLHWYANWALGTSYTDLTDALSPKPGFKAGRKLTTLPGMNRFDVEYIGPGDSEEFFTGKILHIGVPEETELKVGDIHSQFEYRYFDTDISDI